MVTTRSGMATEQLQNIEVILNSKFETLKDSLASKECIAELRNLILEQGALISKQNEAISELKREVNEKEERIAALESHVSILQNTMNLLKRRSEENEQYQRRHCLRIVGIEPVSNDIKETGENCLEKAKKVFKDLNVDVPDCSIDRAHRIGSPFKNKKGVPCHAMIVKFTTWRHRSDVYKARKGSKYSISPDLTKERYNLLRNAREILDSWDNDSSVDFVYADINCRLMVKLKDGEFKSFNSIDEFNKML